MKQMFWKSREPRFGKTAIYATMEHIRHGTTNTDKPIPIVSSIYHENRSLISSKAIQSHPNQPHPISDICRDSFARCLSRSSFIDMVITPQTRPTRYPTKSITARDWRGNPRNAPKSPCHISKPTQCKTNRRFVCIPKNKR